MKQNQIIAITNGKKSQAEKELTLIHHSLKKVDLLSGIDRTYRPINDEGAQRPPEKKIVQTTVRKSIEKVSNVMENLINLVSMMDKGNCEAKADIVVDDEIIAEGVPATHLIYLEKRINEEIATFVNHLPTLDSAEEWSWNSNIGCYSSEPKESTSTAKTLKHKVLYEATKEHPAQISEYTIDEIVGYWKTILLSGNIGADDKEKMLVKVRKLADAIKIAREQANMTEVSKSDVGTKVIDYLFGDYLTK